MTKKDAPLAERICPQCQRNRLKNWDELAPDEKFIAERQPAGAKFSKEARRQHLFCPNCWLETENRATSA